jgi:hypothetical protein
VHLQALGAPVADLVKGKGDVVIPPHRGHDQANGAPSVGVRAGRQRPGTEAAQQGVELVEALHSRGGIVDARA